MSAPASAGRKKKKRSRLVRKIRRYWKKARKGFSALKAKWNPKVILPAFALLLIIAVLGTYFVTKYRRDLLYARYPLRYKAQIVETAREYGLEPWHVAAVVRCESSFDPKAESGVGARGLMQIMPDTGIWIAGKFGETEDYTDDVLYDVETNLKYGCWYLSWLMDKFGGDIRTVTAAYHAGHGAVQNWLNRPSYSDDGVTLARIPYDSTNTYVQRVLTACEHYKEMYDYDEAS